MLEQEIRSLDPKLPIYNVETLEQARGKALWEKRFQAALIGGFGVLALALASLGLYGVLSFNVAQRTSEIGIRMAVGATTSGVLRLVIGQGVRLIAIGVVLGLVGAFAATRVLKSWLFRVSTTDPVTFTAITLLLSGVALVACWIPARRATKVDPMVALRYE